MIESELAKNILKEIRVERAKKFQESTRAKTYEPGNECLCGNSKLYDMYMCYECYKYQQNKIIDRRDNDK